MFVARYGGFIAECAMKCNRIIFFRHCKECVMRSAVLVLTYDFNLIETAGWIRGYRMGMNIIGQANGWTPVSQA